jgi:Ca-activated chloride channel family protein
MNARRSIGLACFALLGLALGPLVLAVQPGAQEKNRELSHQVSVTAVTIAVTVQDRSGRFVTDLTEKDFSVLENGQPKSISHFNASFEAPFSLTVLLDVSGSMALQDKLRECRDALRSLVAASVRPRDEISLLVFADGQVEVASGFSADKSGFLEVLGKTEAYGQTALNDAVAVSPVFANRGRNERRAMVLLTDGVENDSRASPDQAVEIARRVDVPIYAIGYKIPMSEQFLMKYKRSEKLTPAGIVEALERFSEATGGKSYFLSEPAGLRAALSEIAGELSHQYILGYTTTREAKDEYRKITVLASKARYRVRTRQGY